MDSVARKRIATDDAIEINEYQRDVEAFDNITDG